MREIRNQHVVVSLLWVLAGVMIGYLKLVDLVRL
jgi:hypothetical protein